MRSQKHFASDCVSWRIVHFGPSNHGNLTSNLRPIATNSPFTGLLLYYYQKLITPANIRIYVDNGTGCKFHGSLNSLDLCCLSNLGLEPLNRLSDIVLLGSLISLKHWLSITEYVSFSLLQALALVLKHIWPTECHHFCGRSLCLIRCLSQPNFKVDEHSVLRIIVCSISVAIKWHSL